MNAPLPPAGLAPSEHRLWCRLISAIDASGRLSEPRVGDALKAALALHRTARRAREQAAALGPAESERRRALIAAEARCQGELRAILQGLGAAAALDPEPEAQRSVGGLFGLLAA